MEQKIEPIIDNEVLWIKEQLEDAEKFVSAFSSVSPCLRGGFSRRETNFLEEAYRRIAEDVRAITRRWQASD